MDCVGLIKIKEGHMVVFTHEHLAKCLYEMFEMRTTQAWRWVGEEGNYPTMHDEWYEAADELIEKLSKET